MFGLPTWLIGTSAAAALCVAIFFYGDHRGAARVQFQFDAYRLAIKTVSDAEIARQKSINDQVSEQAKRAADALALQISDRDKEIAAYEAELATRRDAACGFNDADVGRLRSILR